MSNRYKIARKSKNGIIDYFFIKYDDNHIQDTFSLTQIDAFTTIFKNKEELFYFTKNHLPVGWSEGDIWIEYNQNHETYMLDILYSEFENIQKISRETQGSSKIYEYSHVKKYISDLLFTLFKDKELYNYLIDNNYIDSYTKTLIWNYKKYTNKFTKEKLYDKLSEYRIVRNIEIGKRNYEKTIINKQKPSIVNPKIKKIQNPKKRITEKKGQIYLFNPNNY